MAKLVNMISTKFRLWSVKDKCWTNPAILKIDKDGNLYYQRDGEHIAMQFTGLHDKNGKEIFEGDIVCSEIYPNRNNSIVKMNDALDCEPFDYFMSGEDFEVTGNIYENSR